MSPLLLQGFTRIVNALAEGALSRARGLNIAVAVSAAGFQLKGSGWYATDFKNSGRKPDAKPAADKSADAAPAESKSETKTESTAPSPAAGCGAKCSCH